MTLVPKRKEERKRKKEREMETCGLGTRIDLSEDLLEALSAEKIAHVK
jgi:hypothetical protein